MSFIRLMQDNGTTLKDTEHDLVTYKVPPTMSLRASPCDCQFVATVINGLGSAELYGLYDDLTYTNRYYATVTVRGLMHEAPIVTLTAR